MTALAILLTANLCGVSFLIWRVERVLTFVHENGTETGNNVRACGRILDDLQDRMREIKFADEVRHTQLLRFCEFGAVEDTSEGLK